MLMVKWISIMVADLLRFGRVNRSYAMTLGMLSLLVVALLIVAAQFSAPFIYTMF